ncbi:universal stress protein [Jeotgalibacillus sp. R-1-5s-1]|uniref:universal stress protein n=1 Tax=Jeotgalibacillus sp. R-1-5s-1 TaxID=2555897 RepID=UPI00106A6580|nr:universal stress protein [Jeotgalibacillus sp. R-1-5s-1]TFD97681.1 universal stress protein [Jeotgalibacillus sp. R-1-5s-1]
MFKQILVAFDSTAASQKALDAAVELHRLHPDSSLIITHVSLDKSRRDSTMYEHSMNTQTDHQPAMEKEQFDTRQDENNKLNQALLSAKEVLDSRNIHAEFYPLTGSPAEAIVDYAIHKGADLIIVGRTEKSSFQKRFLGSVSETIVEKARCPVLVMR